MLTLQPFLTAPPPVAVQRGQDRLIVDNGDVRITLHSRDGRFDVEMPGTTLQGASGEVRFADGSLRKTDAYARHEIAAGDVRKVRDAFGAGVQVTVHHRSPGAPELRQVFWVYAGRPEAMVRLDAIGTSSVASNYLAPIVTDTPIRFAHQSPLQSLFVPYDNDSYFRYRSDGWGEGEGDGDGSYEVGAIYDAASRHGFVVGSIDHDTWKSAVRFKRNANGEASALRAFAGVTSKYTHDGQPHGTVSGREIRSPRMVIGEYDDWRMGLERYGDLNAKVKAPLPWSGAVPFGWNSWAGHKEKVTAADAQAATDFIHTDLPGFRSDGTAYINFDSFWDNLTRAQRVAFVQRAHAAGLKAGIYWTPYTAWGKLEDPVGDGRYTYRDLALKDAKGEPLPKLDGGWPLDPTHPGTLARIDRQMADFVSQGFDYVKLDFMTHGALEGKHADPKVSTGTAAYAVGMRRIVADLSPKRIGRPFFISLSIAPMFPQGYAHSRRISCDVFANIGASEYLLNSATYGWWTNDRLYRFNDPDHTCVYQPMGESPVTEAEARTRMTASVIVGGMLLEGDDLTKPAARDRVREIFTHQEVLDLARRSVAFRPVEGDTGTKAGDTFVWTDPKTGSTYVAVFNYEREKEVRKTLAFTRLGLADAGTWRAHSLWGGADRLVDSELTVDLPPMDCALIRLDRTVSGR